MVKKNAELTKEKNLRAKVFVETSELSLFSYVSTGPEGGQGYWQARPCQPHGQACQQGRQEDQEGQEVDVTTAVPLLLNLDCRCQF